MSMHAGGICQEKFCLLKDTAHYVGILQAPTKGLDVEQSFFLNDFLMFFSSLLVFISELVKSWKKKKK